jgi:hypothetical protein
VQIRPQILGAFRPKNYVDDVLPYSCPSFRLFPPAASPLTRCLPTFSPPLQVFGALWYLFAVARVDTCLASQCRDTPGCRPQFLGCSPPIQSHAGAALSPPRLAWANSSVAASYCLTASGQFPYGIYWNGLPLVTSPKVAEKLAFPIFWGLMTLR